MTTQLTIGFTALPQPQPVTLRTPEEAREAFGINSMSEEAMREYGRGVIIVVKYPSWPSGRMKVRKHRKGVR